MKNKLLVTIVSAGFLNDCKRYYEKLYNELSEKYNVEHLLICRKKSNDAIHAHGLLKYDDRGWGCFISGDDQEIKDHVMSVSELFEKTFVTTFNEFDIVFSTSLKEMLDQKITTNSMLFNSKDIQRELLLNAGSGLGIGYKKINQIEDLDISIILNDFSFPFVIKPTRGAASRGVFIVNDKNEFEYAKKTLVSSFIALDKVGYKDVNLLIEEYIDGQMYTVDYYVTQDGEIRMLPPLTAYSLKDLYSVDDFGITRQYIDKEFGRGTDFGKELALFIENTVKACNICNTFVHHEFKLTSKGILKSIEINGRIGGFRLMMYHASLGVNMLELLFSNEVFDDIKCYSTLYKLYPNVDESVYVGHTPEFRSYVDGAYHVNLKDNNIGELIGLTRNGYKDCTSLIIKTESFTSMEENNIFMDNYYRESPFISNE